MFENIFKKRLVISIDLLNASYQTNGIFFDLTLFW